MTFEEFADSLEAAAATVKPRLMVTTTVFAASVAEQARDLIGRENGEWAPLAPQTIAEKSRLGYVGRRSATDPLLRTGDMQRSIIHEVEENLFGVEAVVGSKLRRALWQEIGTARIPPRPFLGLAMSHAVPGSEVLFGHLAVSILTPGSR